MTVRRVSRRRLHSVTALVACVVIVTLAACGSSDKKSSSTTTTKAQSSSSGSTKLGVGVTPTTLKLGVALVDFDCVKNFVDEIRVDQDKVYQAYIDDINANGGIAGRKIEPVYDTYCPLGSAGPLAVCTKLTDDDKVFAVMGTFVDFSGDAQTCVAKQHDTVLITYNLTQAIMDKSPPGLIL